MLVFKKSLLFCFWLCLLISCSTDKEEISSAKKSHSDTLFSLVSSSDSGVTFKNSVIENEENNYFKNQYIYNGGGVAVGDINNDGLDDIYFSGNDTPDKLYLNKGGLKFEDITEAAGIKNEPNSWSTGVSFVDLNADGWLDIYVCKAGAGKADSLKRNELYMNLKNGSFYLDSQSALADSGNSTQASFFDYDNDGDLDVYVLNYPEKFSSSVNAEPAIHKSSKDSDHLYRNDGKGTFTDISSPAGIANYAYGLGIITADFNGDNAVDIYVANDYVENDYLYVNLKNGTFKESIKNVTSHNSQSSMGIDRADINNDGFQDFFVAEMLPSDYKRSKENMASMDTESFWYFISQGQHYQYMRNTLQVNNQNGFFSDVAQMAGVDKTDWSWSPVFGDFDNDGLVDLYVSNGIKRDMLNKDAKNKRKALQKQKKQKSVAELYEMIPSTKLSNYVFSNKGDFAFENTTDSWGLSKPSFSNGATSCDLDNDGDLDIIVNNIDDEAFIFENHASDGENNFLKIKLNWTKSPNPNALNALVEIFYQDKVFTREVLSTAGFQSGRSSELHFGLGSITKPDSARVIWPRGETQDIDINELNTTIQVAYKPSKMLQRKSSKKYFEELDTQSIGLDFQHKENIFNDFEREILLPHRQSTIGPGLGVGDVNEDGLDDVFIGGAHEQKSQLFLQTETGTFQAIMFSGGKEKETLDAAIFDADNDGDGDIYTVNGGNELDPKSRIDMYYVNQGNSGLVEFPRGRPFQPYLSGSCIVHADFNQNGYQDIFVAGRAKPGFYPLADSSYFCLNEKGTFKDVTTQWFPDPPHSGFITCAVATDFNNDKLPDLVIAGEWMPVMFYKNTGSGFKDVTKEFGDPSEIGWWYSLKSADLNNDGIEDIIAGNIGLNHKFRPSKELPFVIYYDDYDGNGKGDIVLANYTSEGTCLPVRGKQCMSEQMPFISENKVENYEEFANSDLSHILGKNVEKSQVKLTANMFESSIFYSNSSGTFSRNALPREAQKSAVQGIEVLDLNLDGELDIILTGNMFNTEIETSRADASVGCVLLSGKKPVYNSGFFTPANAKNMKLIHIQNSPHLLVANNNGKVQLFRVLN